MRIGQPYISERGDTAQYEVAIEGFDKGPSRLWYRVSRSFAPLLSTQVDGALVGLLVPAMLSGNNIDIAGPVSPKLLYALGGPAQEVIKLLLPRLKRIAIKAEHVSDGKNNTSGVATGFSGGIDSYAVLATHFFSASAPGYRPTHLLFNSVGSHGETDPLRLADRRFSRLSQAAEKIGLPLIKVESNLSDFYKGLKFQETHTLRNGSVPLILQNGISRLLYASTYYYRDIKIDDTYDIAYADPVLLPLLSADRVDLVSTNSELTRVEKTIRIAELEQTYQNLDVCTGSSGANCSHCSKCMRTMLTLELANRLDRFSAVFDLNRYRDERKRYRLDVALSRQPLMREIADYARENNIEFPKSYWPLMGLPDALRTARRYIRALHARS